MVFILGIQSIVFAVWGYWAFRCLFLIRARAVKETGLILPGMGATLRAFRAFAVLPEHRRDKVILLLLTALLWALIAVFGLVRATA
jgi:hypothetical protein